MSKYIHITQPASVKLQFMSLYFLLILLISAVSTVQNVEFLIEYTNNIDYPQTINSFQILTCKQFSDHSFFLFEHEYELTPKYVFTHFLYDIYDKQFNTSCTIRQFTQECTLEKRRLASEGFTRLKHALPPPYLYLYKCYKYTYPVRGHFSLNQYSSDYLHSIVYAQVRNCQYQIYSKYSILNLFKSILNKLTNNVNHKCIYLIY